MSGFRTPDAESVARALGGRQQPNRSWLCRCPVQSHGQGKRDRRPSLSIAQGREQLLIHCFAGCDASDVLAEIRHLAGPVETWPMNSTKVNHAGVDALRCESQRNKARHLWSARQTIVGSPAATYLREARHYHGPIPPTLGYLPPSRPGRHPALIASFGLPNEPEPGRIAISTSAVEGVHLTLLSPDGSGKAEAQPNKIMVGRSIGWPIVLSPPNDLLGLAVAEGIEDALTLYEATGLGVWAAGSASRLLSLAQTIPAYVDNVVLGADRDDSGQRHALSLLNALAARGIHSEIRFPPDATTRAA